MDAELESHGLQNEDILDILCLQGDLSPRPGCEGPSLGVLNNPDPSSNPPDLSSLLQARYTHLASAYRTQNERRSELFNNTCNYLGGDTASRWAHLLDRSPRRPQPSWMCCGDLEDARVTQRGAPPTTASQQGDELRSTADQGEQPFADQASHLEGSNIVISASPYASGALIDAETDATNTGSTVPIADYVLEEALLNLFPDEVQSLEFLDDATLASLVRRALRHNQGIYTQTSSSNSAPPSANPTNQSTPYIPESIHFILNTPSDQREGDPSSPKSASDQSPASNRYSDVAPTAGDMQAHSSMHRPDETFSEPPLSTREGTQAIPTPELNMRIQESQIAHPNFTVDMGGHVGMWSSSSQDTNMGGREDSTKAGTPAVSSKQPPPAATQSATADTGAVSPLPAARKRKRESQSLSPLSKPVDNGPSEPSVPPMQLARSVNEPQATGIQLQGQSEEARALRRAAGLAFPTETGTPSESSSEGMGEYTFGTRY